MLQPLVENAIRHGLSGRSAAGTIDISATVEREIAASFASSDNGVGLDAASSTAGRGIGLANVRDRLAICTATTTRSVSSNKRRGGTIAELTIPVRRRERHDPSPATDRGAPVVAIGDARSPRASRAGAVSPARRSRSATIWFFCGLVWTQQSFVYRDARPRSATRRGVDRAERHDVGAHLGAAHTARARRARKRFPIRRRFIVRRIARVSRRRRCSRRSSTSRCCSVSRGA